jgi:hypothetical protein
MLSNATTYWIFKFSLDPVSALIDSALPVAWTAVFC